MSELTLFLFSVIVLAGAASDIKSYTIPNWISIALLVAFIPYAFLSEAPLDTATSGLTAAAVMFALGTALWLLNSFGGGDVKMNAAVGLWLGWDAMLWYTLLMTLIGGVLAILIVAARRIGGEKLRETSKGGYFEAIMNPGNGIPYGVAIALAGIWFLHKAAL